MSALATVLNLIIELRQESELSNLFVNYDLAVVERIVHRVAMMYLGQSVEAGPLVRCSRTRSIYPLNASWRGPDPESESEPPTSTHLRRDLRSSLARG